MIYIGNGVKSFLLLINVPKCISRRAILHDIHYHIYHQNHHSQIPSHSVAVATRRRQPVLSYAFLKSQLRPIGARSFSTLRVNVLGRPFGIFHRAAGFFFAASRALKRTSSGKLWQRDWINITGLNEWCRQTKKHCIGIALVGANCSPVLNSVLFKKNASKFQLRNTHIHQQKIFLIFVIMWNH